MFTIKLSRPKKDLWVVTANILGKVVESTGATPRIALMGVEAAYSVAKNKLAADRLVGA